MLISDNGELLYSVVIVGDKEFIINRKNCIVDHYMILERIYLSHRGVYTNVHVTVGDLVHSKCGSRVRCYDGVFICKECEEAGVEKDIVSKSDIT